ncbi:trypsin-like peptidase domain-containing protein [Candidatus Dependentiae bacterium]|nr:trypsin-like peptidase domain-containing protein [Candidatus Dependentiae bacterium]
MEQVKSILCAALGFLCLTVVGGIGFIWKMYHNQQELYSMMNGLVGERGQVASSIDVNQPIIQRVVSQSQVWRPVQKKVKDTVVQIFAQTAEFNMLEPYKAPTQKTSRGSGFFIRYEGNVCLITNAHVINQAKAIWFQVPSMGKQFLDAEIKGISPDHDLALLQLTNESSSRIEKELGKIPALELGDSDLVRRSDEVMALGYPLGQQSLKSTTGVISGREQHMIQMSAAINPGSSGGPLLNSNGDVIGVNFAGVVGAQNVGYIIPINDLKIILPDLYEIPLLRKPFLGVLYNNATESLTEFLGNPKPGGCYVIEVVKGSTLYKAGVQRGDMIYAINGHKLDMYGEMNVPWSEDKVSIVDYVSRLSVGQDVHLVVYRNGHRKTMNVKFSQTELPPIRTVYPGFEDIDYEVVAGMVIMPLTINHIQILAQGASGLAKYAEIKNQTEPQLVVTHIFSTSELYKSRTLSLGATINEVNGVKVRTLEDLRGAFKSGVGNKFLTIKASDHIMRSSENVFVALPFEKVLAQEEQMAKDYHYPLSDTVKQLLKSTKTV